MRKKTKKTETYASIRKKLYSALAMLLVSSIMMVSSTYAWFVLSTAPEVTGIQTQVGANGALEIALLDNQSWTDLTRLDMGDIDENGDITPADALLIARLSVQNIPEISVGDIDGNGIVTSADVVYMKRYLVGIFTPSK